MQPSASAAPTPDQLLDLLQRQRGALLRADPDAIPELEASTREMEHAFAALAAASGSSRGLPDLDAATVSRLQAELQINQATLVQLASGNRRALNVLFGEPALYGK